MRIVILFICSANICRSPMAEGMFRKMLADQGKTANVISAGISHIEGAPPSDGAIEAMREREIDISSHRSSQVTEEMCTKATIVICMAMHHKIRLIEKYPQCRTKFHMLSEMAEGRIFDIPDPIGCSVEEYRRVAGLIERFLIKIFDRF